MTSDIPREMVIIFVEPAKIYCWGVIHVSHYKDNSIHAKEIFSIHKHDAIICTNAKDSSTKLVTKNKLFKDKHIHKYKNSQVKIFIIPIAIQYQSPDDFNACAPKLVPSSWTVYYPVVGSQIINKK
jgi:hypothetical protein